MRFRLMIAALTVAASAALTHAQTITDAFTYQGKLASAGSPVTGLYDLQFRLYTPAGVQVGSTVCLDNVSVTGGLFTVQLSFGAVFDGNQRLLEVAVRANTGATCADPTGFTTLLPRQALNSEPYSQYSLSAASAATALTANNSLLLGGQAPSFYQNAANLSAGTLSDSRLSSNAALLAGSQVFSGTKTFSLAPAFSAAAGSPFTVTSTTLVTNLNADLLDGLHASAFSLTGHVHDASAITTGTLVDARLSSNIALRAGANTFSAANTFSGSLAFTGATFSAPLVHSGGTQIPLQLNSTNTGGTWLTLVNTSTGGRDWDLISSGSGNGEGPGKLLFRDGVGGVRMTLDTGGNLGLGTTSPATRLDVVGTVTADGFDVAGLGTLTSATTGSTLRSANTASGYGLYAVSNTGVGVHGQSTTNVAVEAYTSTAGRALYAERTTNGNKGWLGGLNEGGWAQAATGNGMVAITADANNAGLYCRNDGLGLALNCDGKAQVKIITILGGADLAEQFPVTESGAAEPGTVMAIDADHPGRMTIACGSYCRRVAGVVSGANNLSAGMVLSDGAAGDHDRPIALSGRVWVKCDATGAAIEPGDLLTTAELPGYAMKAADRERAFGAVIGKAMTGLARGQKGLVLVLVTLQ